MTLSRSVFVNLQPSASYDRHGPKKPNVQISFQIKMWPKFSFKFVPDDSVRDLLTNLPIGCCSVKPFKREIDNIWPRDAQKEGTFPPSIKHTHSNVIRAALFVSKNVNPRPLKLRVWRIRLLDLTESLANQMNSTRQSNRTMERLFNELLTSVLCHTQKS